MLDEYFKREDVIKFVNELETNPKYRVMQVLDESKYGKHIQDELALYLFYDIILKYKIIIDDEFLFDEYLSQIEKLFRKIDQFDDIVFGVQKMLIHFVGVILDVHDVTSSEARKEIATYIYDKYVMEGYLVHGFSTAHENLIRGNLFVAERYPNRYAKMIMLQDIFSKYHTDIMDKDFHDVKVTFTDDFIMGCNYSINSPGYFHQLLYNKSVYGDKKNDGYLKKDYSLATSFIKKYMNFNSFSDVEKNQIMETVHEEWEHLHRCPRKVSLLFVKRKRLMDVTQDKLNDYLESDLTLQEIVERILSSKYNQVSFNGTLHSNEFEIVSLDDFYREQQEEKNVEEKIEVLEEKKVHLPKEVLNSYGMVSILLIGGSLFITLGVIISIIMVLRGI